MLSVFHILDKHMRSEKKGKKYAGTDGIYQTKAALQKLSALFSGWNPGRHSVHVLHRTRCCWHRDIFQKKCPS